MVARNRRLVGWAVAVAGAVVAVVGGLADQVGLGGEGPDKFGPSQVAAVIAGVVIVLVGLALAFWPSRPAEPS